jgi:hypothetical protein
MKPPARDGALVLVQATHPYGCAALVVPGMGGGAVRGGWTMAWHAGATVLMSSAASFAGPGHFITGNLSATVSVLLALAVTCASYGRPGRPWRVFVYWV